MRRRVLDRPTPAASPVPRAHFDPKSGWFRRIERAVSLALSRRVWPRVPGASWPLTAILRAHLTLAETEVPIVGLPAAFDGTRWLFVSDVHAGPFLSRGSLDRAFEALGEARADVVIHGGDLATSNAREVETHAAAVSGLRAPLGVFAVLGNHDHYTRDLPALLRFYDRCGVRVLDNDAVAIERAGARVALAGIDDWNFGRPDLGRALVRARETAPEAPIILASHNPDAFFAAASSGVALVLSGHTHGGQVRVPGRPVLVRMSRYRLDDGAYRSGSAHVVVSRGLGVTGLPLRVFCAPEALVVTLRSAQDPPSQGRDDGLGF